MIKTVKTLFFLDMEPALVTGSEATRQKVDEGH